MAEISEELLELLSEEGADVLASFIGEKACDNTLVYQSLFYILSKGVEFVLPTLLSASFGDPTAFTLGLIRRDISKIQKDLDYFREVPFYQIKYLIDEVKLETEDEENHFDAYEKFKLIDRKSIEAIFSSKNFEHRIKAAEISILAKSYIKRFDHESMTFNELHELEDAKKRSLASQMLKLLKEFVQMPEYIEALEKAKDVWYRLAHIRRENHSIVDLIDNLKISIYTNSVLCLPSIQESKSFMWNGEPVLVKSWNLSKYYIPEGERQALETALSRDDLAAFISADDDDEIDEFREFPQSISRVFNDSDSFETGSDDEEDDSEPIEEEEDEENTLPKRFIDDSEDENLSENEDELNDEDNLDTDSIYSQSIFASRQASAYVENSVETLTSKFDTFRIYTDLDGTVYVKAGLKCKLFLNGEPREESQFVEDAWKIEDPPENLSLEFLIMKEDVKLCRNISIRKLNLTEDTGMELINLLCGANQQCNERAEQCLHCGTITVIQWNIPFVQIVDALVHNKDIQSPMFQPLPLDDQHPYFKAIIDGRSKKLGIKKFGWSGDQAPLVAGMIVWNKEEGSINSVAKLKTLSKNVKDLQLKDVNWDQLCDNKYMQLDIFFFSYINGVEN